MTNAVLSNSGDAAIFQAIRECITSDTLGSEDIKVVAFDSKATVTSRLYPEWQIHQQLTQVPSGGHRLWFLVRQGLLLLGLMILAAPGGLLRSLAVSRFTRWSRLGRSLAALNECDVVVSSGGTYLVDHYDFTHRYVELLVAKALGKPVVLWTQSMGPFATRRSKWLVRRLAKVVDGVAFRDHESARHWEAATGFRGSSVVAPDSAFALRPGPFHNTRGAEPKVAVVSVRMWTRDMAGRPLASTRYEAMMRTAAREMDRHGLHVTAMSTCQGVASYDYDDSHVARKVFTELPVDVNADFHTPDQLLSELSQCQLVVTTRMHLAILALVCGVPVIAVAYEFKTVKLFHSIGLAHAVVRLEDASDDWMQRAVARAVSEPEAYRLSSSDIAELQHGAAAPLELLHRLPGR